MDTFNPMSDLPLGFGMGLAENINAMKYFSDLSPEGQQVVIDQTRSIRSRAEMQTFIHQLTHRNDL